jgi:hypothetical protein
MTTPTNNHNNASASKTQQDANPSAPNAAPELSQTEREMQESRRQAERRARMFQRPSSDPVSSASSGDASAVDVAGANGHDGAQPDQPATRQAPANDNAAAAIPLAGGASAVDVAGANGHDSTQPDQLPPREVPANDNVAAPIPLAGGASDIDVAGANGHFSTQPDQLPPREVPANDNVAAPIPLAGGELPRRAIPEDLSIPEFLKRTPAPAPKSPTSSERPTLQGDVQQTEQLRGIPANDNLAASITPVDVLPEPLAAPAPATKPTAVVPTFTNIPAELRALRNWVMWRYVQKPGKKKPDKVPFQPNGNHAKTNDSSTWNTFDICRAAYNGGRFDGVGFVFDGEVGDDGLCYVGADFDDCIEDGNLSEPARGRIERLQTYTEISVSGTGVHSIIRAQPGATAIYKSTNKGHSIEIYSKERYFTFTGAPLGETCGEIRAAASELDALVEEARAAKACQVDQKKAGNHPATVADEGTKNYWFDKLTPEQKDEAVHYMLGPIAEKTKLFELGENGGNNDDWFSLMTALSLTGAPRAEDYLVEFASKAKNADPSLARKV